jgi:hypothetical protein
MHALHNRAVPSHFAKTGKVRVHTPHLPRIWIYPHHRQNTLPIPFSASLNPTPRIARNSATFVCKSLRYPAALLIEIPCNRKCRPQQLSLYPCSVDVSLPLFVIDDGARPTMLIGYPELFPQETLQIEHVLPSMTWETWHFVHRDMGNWDKGFLFSGRTGQSSSWRVG